MLNINIYSFSYKKSGIPVDYSGNGGGFVFDCRFIENPGKKVEFADLNGKDDAVKSFLDSNKDMQDFIVNIYKILQETVNKYIERNFTNLMICFGCTGGQHRSVYAAEKIKKLLSDKYGSKINICISHTEFPELN